MLAIESFLSWFLIIPVLGLLVFVHEFGHFIVARFFKIGVSTFSIGFGKKIFHFNYGQTKYCISAIPLGGYVQLVGESPTAELPKGFSKEDSFILRPAWQKILVVVAGCAFNFLLAIAIFAGIAWFSGYSYLTPKIGEIMPNSPAIEAGLQPGDSILQVNSNNISNWEEFSDFIVSSKGASLKFTIQRDNKKLFLTVTPKPIITPNILGINKTKYVIGVNADINSVVFEKIGIFKSIELGTKQSVMLVKLTGQSVVAMFQGLISSNDLGGPILIAQQIKQQAHNGIIPLLSLTAYISISLAILNLLPIPVLDGGHILFFLIELITKRKINEKLQTIVTKIGLGLLLTLMVFSFYNDIRRTFKSQPKIEQNITINNTTNNTIKTK